jgi:Spy/CpxP family protein refolding chaperone
MKRAGRIGLAVVLLFAVAVPAYAQMGSGMTQGMGSGMSSGMGCMMGGMGPGGSMGMMGSGKGGHVMGYASPLDLKDELKLTVEQVAKLKPMHAEYRKAIIRKSAEVKAANIDLEELLSAKAIDYAKVEKQVKATEGLKSGLMLSRVEALKKVQGVLTPEQFEKYREKARRPMGHGAGAGAGMGMMGGMGQGMMCPMMKMMMQGGMMGQGMMGGGMMGGGMAPAKPQAKTKEPPAQAPSGDPEHEAHHPGK